MEKIIDGVQITYIAGTGDWSIYINTDGPVFFLSSLITPSLTFSSGANFDNLSAFIADVKADALANNIPWE